MTISYPEHSPALSESLRVGAVKAGPREGGSRAEMGCEKSRLFFREPWGTLCSGWPGRGVSRWVGLQGRTYNHKGSGEYKNDSV